MDVGEVMRSTFAIDDDDQCAARELASAEGKYKVYALTGIPLLPIGPNSVPVTSEMVLELMRELEGYQGEEDEI